MVDALLFRVGRGKAGDMHAGTERHRHVVETRGEGSELRRAELAVVCLSLSLCVGVKSLRLFPVGPSNRKGANAR